MAGGELTVEVLLGVVREFDNLGGASCGLVSWELCVQEDAVRPVWSRAIEAGLLESAGQDLTQGEQLWQLSRAGWAHLGISPTTDRRRRDAIDRLGVLSRIGDTALSSLARIASHVSGGTGAAVHVLDDRFQHRVAAHLAPLEKHPTHDAMCRLVVDAERAIIVPDAPTDERFAYSPAVTGDTPIRFYASLPLRTIDEGIVIGTLCTFGREARTLSDEQAGLLGDVAQQIVAQLELTRLAGDLGHLATHDSLTGAVNRLLLADRLEQAVARSERQGTEVLVIAIDLDGLKHVNDEHGHAAGDALLIAVTERLRACFRTTDTVGRLGADEFALIVELAPDEGALEVVLARTREMFREPFAIASTQVTLRASVGTAIAQPSDDLAAVLGRADRAMYADKI